MIKKLLALLIIFIIGVIGGYILNGTPAPGYELIWHITSIAVGFIFISPVVLYLIIKRIIDDVR